MDLRLLGWGAGGQGHDLQIWVCSNKILPWLPGLPQLFLCVIQNGGEVLHEHVSITLEYKP